MGMDRHAATHGRGAQEAVIHVEDVEEHERLQLLPEIGWAHQPGDRALAVAPGPVDDTPPARLGGVAVGSSKEQFRHLFANAHAHVEHLAPPGPLRRYAASASIAAEAASIEDLRTSGLMPRPSARMKLRSVIPMNPNSTLR